MCEFFGGSYLFCFHFKPFSSFRATNFWRQRISRKLLKCLDQPCSQVNHLSNWYHPNRRRKLTFLHLFGEGQNKYGEDSIETAPLWFVFIHYLLTYPTYHQYFFSIFRYEYGNCLLGKEEENPSDDLLGAAARFIFLSFS